MRRSAAPSQLNRLAFKRARFLPTVVGDSQTSGQDAATTVRSTEDVLSLINSRKGSDDKTEHSAAFCWNGLDLNDTVQRRANDRVHDVRNGTTEECNGVREIEPKVSSPLHHCEENAAKRKKNKSFTPPSHSRLNKARKEPQFTDSASTASTCTPAHISATDSNSDSASRSACDSAPHSTSSSALHIASDSALNSVSNSALHNARHSSRDSASHSAHDGACNRASHSASDIGSNSSQHCPGTVTGNDTDPTPQTTTAPSVNSLNNYHIATQKKLNFSAFKIPRGSFVAPGNSKGDNKDVPTEESKVQNSNCSAAESLETARYFSVMWCKLSKKKHKTWEGDAVLVARGRTLLLLDLEGKELGRGSGYKASELSSLCEGNTLVIGSKEIEVMGTLSDEAYSTGKCFTSAHALKSAEQHAPSKRQHTTAAKPFVKPTKVAECSSREVPREPEVRPRHDPSAPDSLVLPRPPPDQVWECERRGGRIVDVVVDPYLSQHLRPHQRHGVTFLYQCVLGMKAFNGQGAILADEMGLGKTLQCISLIWTLLKQGPFGGKPVAKKVLIITPGSLVKNWKREFRKWLGTERLRVYAVSQDSKVQDFVHLAHHPVLIISYEMFMRTYDIVKTLTFDLLVCDEGHRLKNSSIKTTSLVRSLATRRRVVLTGTPVQNDLQELYSLVNFANPSVLGTQSAFRRVYEEPIVQSRQSTATSEQRALGAERAAELSRVTSLFILRRTSQVNIEYLPPKVEVVLLCRPSPLQLQLYRQLLSSRPLRSCLSTAAVADPALHLLAIAALKKLCNHPVLLQQAASRGVEAGGDPSQKSEMFSDLVAHCPVTFDLDRPICADSGKLSVVESLLLSIHSASGAREKIVLVSNYTQTLDVFEALCRCKQYACLRLDGHTPTAKRQHIVDTFNSPHSPQLVLLLSSKAGGVGLNLIGARRLVLYDIDWNPANDLQALARVWRDGQRSTVYIYRLLSTGTIEEKIFQRQMSKQALAGAVVDSRAQDRSLCFSSEELRDLFTLHEDTQCHTHSLLDCRCCGEDADSVVTDARRHATGARGRAEAQGARRCQLGRVNATNRQADKTTVRMDELLSWQHVSASALHSLAAVDPILTAATLHSVSFAFWTHTDSQTETTTPPSNHTESQTETTTLPNNHTTSQTPENTLHGNHTESQTKENTLIGNHTESQTLANTPHSNETSSHTQT